VSKWLIHKVTLIKTVAILSFRARDRLTRWRPVLTKHLTTFHVVCSNCYQLVCGATALNQCVDVFQKPLFAAAAGRVISASGASICVPEEMRYSRPIISEHGLHRSRSGSTSVAQRSQTFSADCHLSESIVFSPDLNSVLMFGGSGAPACFSPLSALVLCVCKPYSNRQLRDRFRSGWFCPMLVSCAEPGTMRQWRFDLIAEGKEQDSSEANHWGLPPLGERRATYGWGERQSLARSQPLSGSIATELPTECARQCAD